jgi:L-methionine (R)-S-oxide reductase
MHWGLRFIPNSLPARKESGRLPAFRLPQPWNSLSELRFLIMPVTTRIEEVRNEITLLAQGAPTAQDLMRGVCKLLHERMLKYSWVGFYMLEAGAEPPVLVLEAFLGAMTPHTRIPLNQGICGAAASSGKTIVVDDVSKDHRYLACSLETKSEIVVPIFVKGQVAGELDIDSHFQAAFGIEDQKLVQYCAEVVGKKLEKSR